MMVLLTVIHPRSKALETWSSSEKASTVDDASSYGEASSVEDTSSGEDASLKKDDASINDLLSSIDELDREERDHLQQALDDAFSPILAQGSLDSERLVTIRGIISAGLFEEASFNSIADMAVKAYVSIGNGAAAEQVEDLVLIGFSFPLTQQQLEMAAKTLESLIESGVDPMVIEGIVSYGIYNGWTGTEIYEAGQGVVRGKLKGLEERELGLSLVIGIEQDRHAKDVKSIVAESIRYLEHKDEIDPEELARKNSAYANLQESLRQSIPSSIGEELYFIAIRDKWSVAEIDAVFSGLIKGHRDGLAVNKLATAFIIRIAQGLGTGSPESMVAAEIEFVRELEKKKINMVDSDRDQYKRQMTEIDQRDVTYVGSKRPQIPNRPQPKTVYPIADRRSINRELMLQSIQQFLGPPPTPYRWGGNSLSGTDCSGFVQTLYREQGAYIPRNSRQQYLTGIMVSLNQLQFGDLVFFSKYFNNYVTHVGIFIGGDKFVHASCSKGVTISSLNEKYYAARLLRSGCKRVIY